MDRPFIFTLLLLVLAGTRSFAIDESHTCRITGERDRRLADSVMAAYRLGGCCDTTIAACLEKDSCSLGRRFERFICYMIRWAKSGEEMDGQLRKREESFFSDRTYDIDTQLVEQAGNPYAPVTVVVYLSADCPLCKKITWALYEAVTRGALEGKATLVVKFLTAEPGDRALMAANSQRKFWEYFELLTDKRGRVDEEEYARLAERIGISDRRFSRMIDNPSFERRLRQSRREARDNHVAITPTVFINGRLYASYKDPPVLFDAIDFEWERMTEPGARPGAGH